MTVVVSVVVDDTREWVVNDGVSVVVDDTGEWVVNDGDVGGLVGVLVVLVTDVDPVIPHCAREQLLKKYVVAIIVTVIVGVVVDVILLLFLLSTHVLQKSSLQQPIHALLLLPNSPELRSVSQSLRKRFRIS
ncbi:hypothetical protein DPMN_047618 [Dreissena polymorpha]|uniref:Uncharacterized protein n=1 Tax=Dreissena polymorpha TaxID=45954 RepID=A0A9D4DAP6_DREPO|nr:hypothetical protein DPMN_047618 [Dreissena polymorpha]